MFTGARNLLPEPSKLSSGSSGGPGGQGGTKAGPECRGEGTALTCTVSLCLKEGGRDDAACPWSDPDDTDEHPAVLTRPLGSEVTGDFMLYTYTRFLKRTGIIFKNKTIF